MRTMFCLVIFIFCHSFVLSATERTEEVLLARQLEVKDSLLLEMSRSDQPKKKLELLKKLATLYLKNDISTSILYAEEMMKLTDKSTNDSIKEIFYGEIATILLYANVYDRALEFYFKSLQISDNAGRKQYSCGIEQNIGAVYFRLRKYDQALVYLQDALKQCEELIQAGDTILLYKQHAFYNNLGLTHHALNNKALALEHIEKAVSLVDTADIRSLSQYYTNLSNLYYETGEVQKAFTYAYKNRENCERLDNNNGIAGVNYQLAYFHFNEGEAKVAKELLSKACVAAEKWKYNLLLSHIYTLYVGIYEAEGNYKTAIEYLKKLREVEKMLVNDGVLSKVSGLKLQYDFDKKIALQEAEISRIKLKQQLSFALAVMTILLAAALSWIIRGRIKRVRKEKKQLEYDLEMRNKELTTNALSLMHNAEATREIIAKLVNLRPNLKPGNTNVINDVIYGLQGLTREGLWSDFEVHFNRVHLDFYRKLQRISPDLTPAELKLCAFLRLNMSTKEISSLTQSSDRSIDVMRGRIRKKLNITNTTANLITFLSDF